mgnify:FL=1
MDFKQFHYKSIVDVEEELKDMNLNLPLSKNLDALRRKVAVGNKTIPNSIAVQPMEGCDGNSDGTPGELTFRRYRRFASGGAGLIWMEACAIVPEGRANPRQLMINRKNAGEFSRLHDEIIDTAYDRFKGSIHPICILQLTHSGRYSRPSGSSEPLIACHNPYLDKAQGIDKDVPQVTDDYLEKLEDIYVDAAVLAYKSGFDGVDIKSCHRYLSSELLSSFTREGRYGGSFEGRTRLLADVVGKIKQKLPKDFIVTSRLNIYDAIPYPYGFGVDKENFQKYDMTEPIKLIKILHEKGMPIINLTMGNPYYNPHINRPFDKGPYVPSEHPLFGVARLSRGIAEVKKAVPDIVIIGSGYSYLREFSPYLAAGNIENGNVDIAGFGRESFAYPDFPSDIFNKGSMDPKKCCITCSKCTELMRAKSMTGCVVRDSGIYAPLYKKYCIK